MDYQREKTEVSADVDKIELNHLQDVKLIKDRIIDTEVEVRKVKSHVEKQNAEIAKEETAHTAKMSEW